MLLPNPMHITDMLMIYGAFMFAQHSLGDLSPQLIDIFAFPISPSWQIEKQMPCEDINVTYK